MEPVLAIERVPYDKSVEVTGDFSSMTADQYFTWVQDQASTIPDIVSVKVPQVHNQTQYMPRVSEIAKCDPSLLPDQDWQKTILSTFSSLRMKLERFSTESAFKERRVPVPMLKDREAWEIFCFKSEIDASKRECLEAESLEGTNVEYRGSCDVGHEVTGVSVDDDDDDDDEDEMQDENMADDEELEEDSTCYPKWEGDFDVLPSTSLLLQFDQVMTQRVLGYHIDWLEDRELTSSRAQWLYALLSHIEKPLHRDIEASLRQCFRRCCFLRSNVSILGISQRDPETIGMLARLNTIIVICGCYFGQGEEFVGFMSSIIGANNDRTPLKPSVVLNDDDDSDSCDSNEIEEDAEEIDSGSNTSLLEEGEVVDDKNTILGKRKW